MGRVTDILAAVERGEAPPQGADLRSFELYDEIAISTTTAGRNEMFTAIKVNNNYDVRNTPWDGGLLPSNRGLRILALGVLIQSEVGADIRLIELGTAFSIEVEDSLNQIKLDPVPMAELGVGGQRVVEVGTVATDAASNQGPAGTKFKLGIPIDVDPHLLMRGVLWVPTALGAIGSTTTLTVVLSCIDLQTLPGEVAA